MPVCAALKVNAGCSSTAFRRHNCDIKLYSSEPRKIDEAVDAGEDPYELKVDRKKVRRAKPVKKARSKKERANRK